MASGGDSDTTIYAGPIPQASQLFVSKAAGNSASVNTVNGHFALENVKNLTTAEHSVELTQFSDETWNVLADRIGDTMIRVQMGELLEKKDKNHTTGFQEELKLVFEAMLNEYRSDLATKYGIDAEVRQGENTSTNIANMTKCAVSSQIDISVVFKKDKRAAVCGVCEVKREVMYDEHAKYEQYVASISKQRSTQKSMDGSWLLIGLVVTEKRAYITQLRAGTWWGYLAEVDSVERYNFKADNQRDRGFEMLAVIRRYLQRLFANFCDEQLFCDPHKLGYFTYPHSPDIVRSTASHIIKCHFGTVCQYLSAGPTCKWKNECSKEDEVIVKVVSKAVYKTIQSGLSELLHRFNGLKEKYEKYEKDKKIADLKEQLRRMQLRESASGDQAAGDTKPKEQEEQPTKPPDYVYSMLANHVWIGSCRDNSHTTVCITRWLGDRVCRSDVLSKWTAMETRRAFFDQVCAPALGVIKLGCYHGDIRLPNIVVHVRNGSFQFNLIDWNELVSIETDRGFGLADRRYPIRPDESLWSEVDKWAELFTVCQLYVCAIIITMVAKESDAEAAACELESKLKDETHFWERSCPKNPIHAADERGKNGLAELRRLIHKQPDEHLSGNLNRLLKQVLDISMD